MCLKLSQLIKKPSKFKTCQLHNSQAKKCLLQLALCNFKTYIFLFVFPSCHFVQFFFKSRILKKTCFQLRLNIITENKRQLSNQYKNTKGSICIFNMQLVMKEN